MTDDQRTARLSQPTAQAAKSLQSEQQLALEIIRVLAPHPRGLRRWSVMRAIRNNRDLAAQDIPQKLEIDVERAFRRFCAGPGAGKSGTDAAPFFRPEEKAGEVWAVHPERLKTWLERLPEDSAAGKISQTLSRSCDRTGEK